MYFLAQAIKTVGNTPVNLIPSLFEAIQIDKSIISAIRQTIKTDKDTSLTLKTLS